MNADARPMSWNSAGSVGSGACAVKLSRLFNESLEQAARFAVVLSADEMRQGGQLSQLLRDGASESYVSCALLNMLD
jgi:hypothetical protein